MNSWVFVHRLQVRARLSGALARGAHGANWLSSERIRSAEVMGVPPLDEGYDIGTLWSIKISTFLDR